MATHPPHGVLLTLTKQLGPASCGAFSFVHGPAVTDQRAREGRQRWRRWGGAGVGDADVAYLEVAFTDPFEFTEKL